MVKNIFFSLFFLFKFFNYFAQSIPEYEQFEVYKQDKNNKILIIPFENKMYSSSIDNEIAEYNRLNYSSIKEEMKKGISEQILLSISNKTPAISLEHHKESNSQILNYIYNSIGLKYEKVKSKDTVEVTTKKTDLIKERLNKFVHQTNQLHEKAKYDRGNLNNGEIHTFNYNEERFMNVIIQNPNLLEELNNKYRTNYYIFINEFHIGRALAIPGNVYLKKRQISTHYTVFNQRGKEVDAGVIRVQMPEDVYSIKKIERDYISLIARELCSFIPEPKVEKATLVKEAKDNKNSKNQRKIIYGVLE
ncbi:MAG: hypothetical protein CL841_06940 [Crocinitomicaceae bacterium]|nr:hypothetical protein [Crocinitomicaceae bacterium]|tara:strand:- start:360 stop:1274 length:915 start_codon:yes stop_codon:yes gene_type:complete